MPAKNKDPASPKVAAGVGADSGGSGAQSAGQAVAGSAEVGQPALAGTGITPPISTTMPDELLRHDISDEELDVLCDPSRDELWELKWAAFGAFLATVPSAVEGLYRYSSSANKEMSVLTLIQLAITLVALAIWLVLRFVVPQRTAKSIDKRDQIRARTKRIRGSAAG